MKQKQNAANAANEQRHPGAGFTPGKNREQSQCLEKQYTRELNNNPRNEGKIV